MHNLIYQIISSLTIPIYKFTKFVTHNYLSNYLSRNNLLTEEERKQIRIAVAQDIINCIDNYNIKSRNTYIASDLVARSELTNLLTEDPRENAIIIRDNCKVCILAAFLLSLIKIDDKYDFERFTKIDNNCDFKSYERFVKRLKRDNKYDFKKGNAFRFNSVLNKLLEIFDYDQIFEIEEAFEEFTYFGKSGSAYLGDKERVVGICKNILKNHGTFLNSDFEYVYKI